MEKLKKYILSSITGLDAIQRAPIVNDNTGLKCLRIGDVSQQNKLENWGFTSANLNDVSSFLIKKGDTFVARTGSTIGCSFYSSNDLNAVFNNGLIRLRTNDKMLPKYLGFLVQTFHFKKFINNIGMASATQPNIKISDLLDYDLIVPELVVQQHIVNIKRYY